MDSLFYIVLLIILLYIYGYMILSWISWKQHEAGNHHRAMWILNQAIRLNPWLTQAYITRGAIRENYFHDYKGAIEDCTLAIRRKANNAMAYNNRGYAYYRLGYIDKGIKDLDKALDLQPELLQAQVNRLRILHTPLQDYEEAILQCENSIHHHPKEFVIYVFWTVSYIELKEFALALEICQEALENGLNPAYVHILRANILHSSSGLEDAQKEIDLALRLKPKDPLILTMLADIYVKSREYEKSIDIHTNLILLNPKLHESHCYRGTLYNLIGHNNKANEDYKKALVISPYSALAYNNRAYMLSHHGDYVKALQDANRSIELEPIFVNGYTTRGEIYFLMEDYESALADFEKARTLREKDEFILAGQAVVLFAMGDKATAKSCWQQVLQKDRKYVDVEEFAKEFAPTQQFIETLHQVASLT